MAGNDKVIDELQIKVQGTANDAINSLSKLQTQLRHTARSLGAVSAGAKSLDRLGTAFRQFDSININNLTRAVDQLERMSKINLKNFDGKKFEIKLSLAGADEVIRKQQAVQKALDNIDTKGLSKKFADSMFLSKADSKKLESVFQQALTDVASGKGASQAFIGWYNDIAKNGAEVLKENWVGSIDQIKQEYDNLVAYLKKVKIKPPSDDGTAGKMTKQMMEDYGLTSIDRSRYFSKNGKSIDSFIDDMLEPGSGMTNLLQGLDRIKGDEDIIIELFARMKQARDLLANGKTIKVFDLDEKHQEGFWSDAVQGVSEQSRKVEQVFASEVDKEMARSADKIPLNVDIDAERIRQQINNAIKTATQTPYDFPLKLNLEKSDLKNQFTELIKGLDFKNLDNVSSKLQETSVSMAQMKDLDLKGSGINSFVGAMRKLGEVDTTKVNLEPFKGIVDIVREISGVDKIQAGVTQLVASLAKLAAAGGSTRTTAKFLPALGEAVKTAAGHLASVGGLPDQMNAFVSSLASLANAGNKTSVTAENLGALGASLKTFLENIQGAPQASENLIRMTEALGVLASSGGKAGAAAKSIGKSINNMGEGSQKAHNRLQAISGMIQNLGDIFSKAAGYVKQGAMKIIDSLRKIKSSSNGLERATSSIKNMIGAMIGFRGITGFGNLIKETIQLGAAMTEIDHIVESVFGDMAGYVDGWAKNAITEFGIAEQSAKQYAGVLSSMFQASQIGYMDAGKMSMDLVELAGDLSAFYNIDTETAFNKIRSGMAGMVRPLRDLGIDLTAATLNEFALSQGITKSYTAMTQAEKVMLRYRYLMANTTKQSGDFSRTSGRSKRAA